MVDKKLEQVKKVRNKLEVFNQTNYAKEMKPSVYVACNIKLSLESLWYPCNKSCHWWH